MSSSIIQKEHLSAYQRWELDSFDCAAPDKNPEPDQNPAVILPTTEQIDRIRQQAQAEGHAAGYQMGKNQTTFTCRFLIFLKTLRFIFNGIVSG